MTKDVGILVLGLLVAAMPFLGFPSSIEQIIFVVSGLIIAALAFFIRGELVSNEQETESFVQNGVKNHSKDRTVGREQDTSNGKEDKKNE